MSDESGVLPSFSLSAGQTEGIAQSACWPSAVTGEWAGATGVGVRVCVVDSGVEASHPLVGGVERSVVVVADEKRIARVVDDEKGDVFGRGTACAGIVRSIAPDCEIVSVRVLGPLNRGSGELMLAGLDWAIREGYELIDMSLSTTNRELLPLLHELADRAYFRNTTIVASAHNIAVESFPWRVFSVVSVGMHEERDPMRFYYNPRPPVECYARGLDVDVAWKGGGVLRSSGNSFASAHLTGVCALIRSKHPALTSFELKSVLRLTAANVSMRER